MRKLSKGERHEKVAALMDAVSGLKVSVYAAHACYFIVLSVFPSLVLLLGLLRYTGIQVESLTAMLEGVIPAALMSEAKRFIISTYRNTSGTMVSISALTALWSASRGIYGLLTGLNSIYQVSENRGYIYTRTVSVLYTFLFFLVLLLTLVLHVFGTTILRLLPTSNSLFLQLLPEVLDLRFFLLLFLQTGMFTAIFMVLPNRRNRLRDSLPGALLASIGWLAVSDLYSIYVKNFSGYANIYGSVYAVALSMLWLYFCISVVFYGGALNRYLMDRKK